MRLIAIDPGSHVGHAVFDIDTGKLLEAGQWDSVEGTNPEWNTMPLRLSRTEVHINLLSHLARQIEGRKDDAICWAIETYPLVAYARERTVALAKNLAFRWTIEKEMPKWGKVIQIPAPKSGKNSRKFEVEALYPQTKTWRLGEHARDAIVVGHKALARLRTEAAQKG